MRFITKLDQMARRGNNNSVITILDENDNVIESCHICDRGWLPENILNGKCEDLRSGSGFLYSKSGNLIGTVKVESE